MRARPNTAFVLTPFWLDAFLAVCLVHAAFITYLARTGWSSMAYDWLRSFRDWETWIFFFLPGYILLLIPMLIWRGSRRLILVWGSVGLFILLTFITLRLTD